MLGPTRLFPVLLPLSLPFPFSHHYVPQYEDKTVFILVFRYTLAFMIAFDRCSSHRISPHLIIVSQQLIALHLAAYNNRGACGAWLRACGIQPHVIASRFLPRRLPNLTASHRLPSSSRRSSSLRVEPHVTASHLSSRIQCNRIPSPRLPLPISRHHHHHHDILGVVSLWCGFAVAGSRERFFFAGDTAYCSVFGKIGERYGPFDLGKMTPEILLLCLFCFFFVFFFLCVLLFSCFVAIRLMCVLMFSCCCIIPLSTWQFFCVLVLISVFFFFCL